VLESVAVNKWNLSALSLVAAVPAGFLAYLMVATFLFQVQNLNWKFQVLAGATLAFSAPKEQWRWSRGERVEEGEEVRQSRRR
jgi:hypothetical protein